jgi:cell division control protein 6
VLVRLNSTLNNNVPQRGYSPQDLLDFLRDFIEKEDTFLILVLDELDSLDKKGAELLYSLVRINDDTIESKVSKRLNIIGIVRNVSFLSNLVRDIHHYFLKQPIVFEKYTRKQIFNILKQRASISFNENVISDNILQFISEIVYEIGDVRCGLNILWSATKIAENKGLNIINLNCVKRAYQDLVPYTIKDTLYHMAKHKLLLLYTITAKLKENGNLNIYLSEAVEDYKKICKLSGIPPRAYSQLWNYIQECKKDEILKVGIESSGIRGRKAFFRMPEIPLNRFVQNIKSVLESRKILT